MNCKPTTGALRIVPTNITKARAFVRLHHSHLDAPVSGLLAAAVASEGVIVCVAMLSRPVARALSAGGATAEVSRVASDGTTEHAASMCLGAITRAALTLGYQRLVSYTLLGEAGTIYKACGWWPAAIVRGRQWNCASRPRESGAQPGDKARWEFGPGCVSCEVDAKRVVEESVGKVALRPRNQALDLFAPRPAR